MSAVQDGSDVRVELEVVHGNGSVNGHRVVAWPDPFVAHAGTRVSWRSDHPFVVRFELETPVQGGLEIHSEPGSEDARHGASAVIRGDAVRLEPFKYTVAMAYDGRVLIADPDGVVDPDPR
jgi:hypothetical protein